ncbi:MAG: flagellar assembly peptidoglycan hydrolase FlgJ [Burkholderiaceae bacterium]|uniref:Peptidoglycan hydrolase FlgJ n=1 Tax=Herminiimonas contaminans TaxID=1111140 RepID=A0ABS0ERF9_9BURK|nr:MULTISPECIES: flagellar assembly peptidoglycan hydrolase FlgJ [Oxalobacteraceae]MBF8177138.1 flagellar assembly peptidoglycan hydrolase FlgJ [Herminiimonas contaminans]MBX9797894.1 flagellar assembly peptidoglycan hydrolase FlgJ [Burkholderiaceae bacterium]
MITPADNSNTALAIDSKGLESLKQSARQNSPDSLKAAATQFEALFVNMIMKSMREATPQDGLFDNQQTKMYTSMLDQQLSQNMASRGIGLADVLIRQLSSTQMATAVTPDGADATKAVSDTSDLRAEILRNMAERNALAHQRSSEAHAMQARGGVNNTTTAASAVSKPAHVQAFQDKVAAHAEEASRTTGIPAKFMLGQAALESGWGKRVIRTADGGSSHNLFGIKAGANWKGKTVDAVTTEYVDGVAQKRVEKFRAYDSYADSFRDYAQLMRNNPRYEKVLANASDVKGFAQGLQRAGYATDPNYATKLTNIINRNLSA